MPTTLLDHIDTEETRIASMDSLSGKGDVALVAAR